MSSKITKTVIEDKFQPSSFRSAWGYYPNKQSKQECVDKHTQAQATKRNYHEYILKVEWGKKYPGSGVAAIV